MRRSNRGRARSLPKAAALILGAWFAASPPAIGSGDGLAGLFSKKPRTPAATRPTVPGPNAGTLGYGPPGLHPGPQGFGLGYHPGYGYGGSSLGVGAEGGYPFYGGPGYPHPGPDLRRIGREAPFPYFGGPGCPSPGQANFFGGVGPLAPDPPVVSPEGDDGESGSDRGYGQFNGLLPYPESTFAPSVSPPPGDGQAAPPPPPSPSEPAAEGAPGGPLGLDVQPFIEGGRPTGLMVMKVYPRGFADRAGLAVGDVIRSINGHSTEGPSHLTWIVSHAPADQALTLSVRVARDGETRTLRSARF